MQTHTQTTHRPREPREPRAPRAAGDPCADGEPAVRLEAAQLLALQLHARGYSVRQLAALVPTGAPGGASALLRAAAQALGVRTVPAAIAEARRSRLID